MWNVNSKTYRITWTFQRNRRCRPFSFASLWASPDVWVRGNFGQYSACHVLFARSAANPETCTWSERSLALSFFCSLSLSFCQVDVQYRFTAAAQTALCCSARFYTTINTRLVIEQCLGICVSKPFVSNECKVLSFSFEIYDQLWEHTSL